METKTCTRCGRERPISEFSPRKGHTVVRSSWCRECVGEYRRNRYVSDPEFRALVKRGSARQYAGVKEGEKLIQFLEEDLLNRVVYCKRCEIYHSYRLADGQEDLDTVPCPKCGKNAEVFGSGV